jgi:argininosuccinate lyase
MSNKIWGGRFTDDPSEIMARINASIDFDKRLYAQDIASSRAHAAMLAACGIITHEDQAAIDAGLTSILGEIEDGRFVFNRDLEDIHLNIEARLTALIGDAGRRLHTARSRNDQVATDFRLYVRDTIGFLARELTLLMRALTRKAEAYADAVMPGFTHLQTAQPVTFGHHCLAYVEMFGRDRGRFEDARRRLNECPLGAAALAGTSFPIDRQHTAKALGFTAPMRNSLDAVSARDFVLETLAAASICAIHLSRLADELVLWSSSPFGFIRFSDRFASGSSIMPQKRNPDAAELVRGKAGRIVGALNALLTMMKGLPLAYSKDMQEDKEPTFDALDTLSLGISATTGMINDLVPQTATMKAAACAGYSTATDLADWLVREFSLPFREAHHITGRIVQLAEQKKLELSALSLKDMRSVEPRIHEGVFTVLSVERSVESRMSEGGTAPANVRAQAQQWRQRLDKEISE